MVLPILDAALSIGDKLIDRLWPDPEQRATAKLELLRLNQAGEFKELELRMQAIVAEAQSPDPWTSRARPTLFYVLYTYILAAIPYGVLWAFRPEDAQAMAAGVAAWLAAIPDALWTVFGAGFLGYGAFRTIEKVKGAAK